VSLVVSLRVPDGIVVAADSLTTSQNLIEFVARDINLECANCKETIRGQEIELPPIPIPFSASSYTQKLLPIHKRYAISAFGKGVLNNKSMYYHVKQFERLAGRDALVETFNCFIRYLEAELLLEYPQYREEAPADWHPIGFHINGFENDSQKLAGVTYELFIGRDNIIQRRDNIGCTIGGEMKVVHKLWELAKEDKRVQFKYGLLSLQDAIDLSIFFINTTSTFQRFTNEVQTVGGEIDIALLTPFHGFQWIKRKKLMEILEETDEIDYSN